MIGVIASSGSFKRLVSMVAKERNEDVLIEFGALGNAVQVARRMIERHKIRVIITTSITGEILENTIDVPVVSLGITNYSLIIAINQARRFGDKIFLLDVKTRSKQYDINVVNDILGTHVQSMVLPNGEHLEERLLEIQDSGAQVLLCTGNCMMAASRRSGSRLRTLLVTPTREEVDYGFVCAHSIVDSKRREDQKIKWMEAIIDNSYDGIMMLDNTERIQFLNSKMAVIASIPADGIGSLRGKRIRDLADKNALIRQVYGDGSRTLGDLIEDGAQRYAVNRNPVTIDGDYDGCIINVQRVSRIQELEQNIRKNMLKNRMIAKHSFDDIIGQSSVMKRLKDRAYRYAQSRSTICIYGESGTGKEIFGQSIHNASPCKNGPFVGVNCAALPENLLESELFGYDDGAFTGARKGGKPGLFEMAHEGTLFLDEIGEMSMSLQAKLLRVLQEKEVFRIGGDRTIPVNVRLICASNKDLRRLVEEGKFREDLFYRLNVLTLCIPSLRERLDDIPELARRFLEVETASSGRELSISSDLLNSLRKYHWPGNVREIRNFIERLVVLTPREKKQIDAVMFSEVFDEFIEHNGKSQTRGFRLLPVTADSAVDDDVVQIKVGTMEYMQDQIITSLHTRVRNVERLSKFLGISRTTIWRKLRKHKGVRSLESSG